MLRTRRANGSSSISTTRRPSLSTTLTHPINPLASTSSNVYHPPHHYNRQSAANNTTYGKEDLLSIFRNQDTSGTLSKNIPDLLEGDLNSAGSGGWGRSEEPASGVELCWEKEGGLKPIAFEDLTEEEREVCRLLCAYPCVMLTLCAPCSCFPAVSTPLTKSSTITPTTTKGLPTIMP